MVWSETEHNRLLQLIEVEGVSMAEAAEQLNRREECVKRHYLKKVGPRRQTHGFWTPEKIDLLRQLRKEGVAFSAIGIRLGCSRSAAVGKHNRLFGRKQSPKSPAPTSKNKNGTPSLPKLNVQQNAAGVEMPIPVTTEFEAAAAECAERHPTVLTVANHQCKWPLDRDEQGTWRFCGGSAIPGKPYCSHHASRSVRLKEDAIEVPQLNGEQPVHRFYFGKAAD